MRCCWRPQTAEKLGKSDSLEDSFQSPVPQRTLTTQAARTNPKPKTKCTMNSEPVKVLPIREIADQLEIPEDYLEYYGKYTAKLRLELLPNLKVSACWQTDPGDSDDTHEPR